MEKFVTFLLIASFLIIQGCSVPILSSAGGPAGATSFALSLKTTFSQPLLFMLLCAGSVSRKIRLSLVFLGFPVIRKVASHVGQAHAAACSRQLLFGHVFTQFFMHASLNYGCDVVPWLLSDWNNN